MTLEEMEAHFRANPPRLPETLTAVPLRHDGPWGGHHEPFAVHWTLRCTCGSDRFTASIWAGEHEGQALETGPAVLRCAACQSETTVFDARRDGFAAIACEEPATLHGPDFPSLEQQVCRSGAGRDEPFRIAIVLHYPDDLFTPEFDGLRGRESDLFTWFHLLGLREDAGGGTAPHQVLLDLECI